MSLLKLMCNRCKKGKQLSYIMEMVKYQIIKFKHIKTAVPLFHTKVSSRTDEHQQHVKKLKLVFLHTYKIIRLITSKDYSRLTDTNST